MSENDKIIDGFEFIESDDYYDAKREAEAIEYMKANNDLEDPGKAVKLYHKLVEQNTLRTVVGHAFLKELQDSILKAGIVSRSNLPNIRIERRITYKKVQAAPDQLEKKEELISHYRSRLRNSRIISIFLLVIIVIMMLIAIYSDRTKFTNYKNEILNQYSSWEEDLDAREKALREKEEQGNMN